MVVFFDIFGLLLDSRTRGKLLCDGSYLKVTWKLLGSYLKRGFVRFFARGAYAYL